MMPYQTQIQRIKTKLIAAQHADPDLEVFGADAHQYQLNAPIPMQKIIDFEQQHGIQLPIEYKLFLTEIGHAGESFSNSAAGPFYGIYPFGEQYQLFSNDFDQALLTNPTLLTPHTTHEIWQAQIQELYAENLSDHEYEQQEAKIFGGLFVIGSQGCGYSHALILNGIYTGKVVNISIDHDKPKFGYEAHFLDWYERWLDEVIDGNLQNTHAWFGYQMGGTESDLMQRYKNTQDHQLKYQILEGLNFKKSLTQDTLQQLLAYCPDENNENQIMILSLVSKHDAQRAVPYLEELFKTQLNTAVKLIHWYIEEDLPHWISRIYEYLPHVQDEETFRFACYILQKDEQQQFQQLKPFVQHPDFEIRKSTFYTFSFLNDKKPYETEFLHGLDSNEPSLLIQVLQAMQGLKTRAILKKLQALVVKFPYQDIEPDENGLRYYSADTDDLVYISSNISNVLKEYNLNHDSIQHINPETFEFNP